MEAENYGALVKNLRIKWKTALRNEFDKQAKELIKNPEKIEKKLLPYIAEIVHRSTELENKI